MPREAPTICAPGDGHQEHRRPYPPCKSRPVSAARGCPGQGYRRTYLARTPAPLAGSRPCAVHVADARPRPAGGEGNAVPERSGDSPPFFVPRPAHRPRGWVLVFPSTRPPRHRRGLGVEGGVSPPSGPSTVAGGVDRVGQSTKTTHASGPRAVPNVGTRRRQTSSRFNGSTQRCPSWDDPPPPDAGGATTDQTHQTTARARRPEATTRTSERAGTTIQGPSVRTDGIRTAPDGTVWHRPIPVRADDSRRDGCA